MILQGSIKADKLLSIELEAGKFITKAKITGDFFLHPEEKVAELEKALIGLPRVVSERVIRDVFLVAVEEHGIDVVGFSAGDFAKLVWRLLNESNTA